MHSAKEMLLVSTLQKHPYKISVDNVLQVNISYLFSRNEIGWGLYRIVRTFFYPIVFSTELKYESFLCNLFPM